MASLTPAEECDMGADEGGPSRRWDRSIEESKNRVSVHLQTPVAKNELREASDRRDLS